MAEPQTQDKEVYNPKENKNDEKIPETVEQVLQEDEVLMIKELAERIEKHGLFSSNTARSKLYYAIEDIRNRANVEVFKEKGDDKGSAGDDAWQWRLSE